MFVVCSNMYGDKRRREQETSYMQELVELITSVSNPESLNMTQEKLAPLLERWNQMNRKDQQQGERKVLYEYSVMLQTFM